MSRSRWLKRAALAVPITVLLFCVPTPAFASAGVAGKATALSYFAGADNSSRSRIARVGGYSLDGECAMVNIPTPNTIRFTLAVDGPRGRADMSVKDSTDDGSTTYPYAGTIKIPVNSGVAIVSPASGVGHFEREAGTVTLRSRGEVVQLDVNAIADDRSGHDDCALYGTATPSSANRSVNGVAARLAFSSGKVAGYRQLASVGPYDLDAACRAHRSTGYVELAVAGGPTARFSLSAEDAVDDSTFTPVLGGGRVRANAHDKIWPLVLAGNSGHLARLAGTAFIRSRRVLVRVEFDATADLDGDPHCTIGGTAVLVRSNPVHRGEPQPVLFRATRATRPQVAGRVGPYAFRAQCSTGGSVQLDLGENGPASLDNYAALDSPGGATPPFATLGGQAIAAQSPDSYLVFPLAAAGDVARHDGTSFLASTKGLVALEVDAVADARTGHRPCALMGTATFAREPKGG